MCLCVMLTKGGVVVVNLWRQLDWIWNHLGNILVHESMAVPPEELRQGGKTPPECGQHHLMGLVPV